MVVRNNVNGKRSQRYYGSTNTEIGKTLEKLSSGYRINRAGDDAAGLAISEKMRLQITGLGRARENSQDGTKLIQTGEGALQEVQDMLDRAEYLAGESANGTYMDELDRENLQKELDHIRSEIDRITTSANFNGIELFQDEGAAYEQSKPDPAAFKFQQKLEILKGSKSVVSERLKAEQTRQQAEKAVSNSTQKQTSYTEKPAVLSSNAKLDALLEGQEKGDLNIVYIQDDTVDANPQPNGSITNPTVTINGQSVNLGDILQKAIVPNIVTNILNNYPAFSYLKGSSIGIGLEYFHGNSTTDKKSTLAYVAGGVSSSGQGGYTTYTLGVNLDLIPTWDTTERQKLESTIAHEMIHAFMDEAMTAGMFGIPANPSTGLTSGQVLAEKFPGWFREGMAQTASGHNDWIHPGSVSGLKLTASSSDSDIKAQIQDSNKKLGSDTTASRYSTGYLACMYLGWVIAGNGSPSGTIDAATISSGLNKLLSEVIGGSSLSDAINKLTNGKFASMADFEAKFNSVDNAPGLCDFTRGLLGAIGSGRGGLVSGNLAASDLVPDTSITGVKLFELNPNNSEVKNVYPNDYQVITGGTTSKPGVAPTDLTVSADYGDFEVTGTDLAGVSYDSTTNTLTVSGSADVTITMKAGFTGSSSQKIKLSGTGKVTLDGVDTSGDIAINADTQITVTGVNKTGSVTMGGNTNAVFEGGGRLETGTFTSNNTNDITLSGTALVTGRNIMAKDLTIQNGTVIARNGNGTISGNVIVNGAAVVAGTLSPSPASHKDTGIPWSGGTGGNDISALGNLASVTIDGVKFDAPIAQNTPNANLWLDPASNHKVTFTDISGNSKTLTAKQVFETDGTTFKEFTWGLPPRPFTVKKSDGTDAVEGQDFEYDADGTTLIIKKPGELTISGGINNDDPTNPVKGRIKLEDNIGGDVTLNLDGCNVDVSNTAASAFDLGNGNKVTLNLVNGTENTFKSGNGFAGIHVGEGTALTIEGTDNDKLIATGGADGAGIGSNGTGVKPPSGVASDWKDWTPTSSITINGGNIEATGTTGTSKRGSGAGIGAGTDSSFGTITITGGIIKAQGGVGGAGIGGAGDDGSKYGTVGNIEITGGTITAKSEQHGAGIGGGWGTGKTRYLCHDIHIGGTAQVLEASSGMHGTGIGAGCLSKGGNITIDGDAVIESAKGGSSGAGIGASSSGLCGNIEISGNATIKKAEGGNSSAGIGAGSGSNAGTIKIDTTGSVNAEGGTNGVGIGSGYGGSTVGNIQILKGTVSAKGNTDSTGIGAGRNSTSGNIQIGDPNNPNNQVIVNAKGGMTNDGGNILSYSDTGHKNKGSVTIYGENTSVRTGEKGEGLSSTSGVTDSSGNNMYSYPLYINGNPPASPELEASKGLNVDLTNPTEGKSWGKLPLLPATDTSGNSISIDTIVAIGKDGTKAEWSKNITHVDSDGVTDNYVYLWMTGQDQDLTITYSDGSSVNLHLTFYEDSGKFRIDKVQERPAPDEGSGYHDDPKPDPTPDPDPDPDPGKPTNPSTPTEPVEEPVVPEKGKEGIILQIGANYGEILEVPRFYLSARALGLGDISIATQDRALEAMGVLREAINRVSYIRGDYGALQNRLEHNINDLGQARENMSDAESRIRDADMAEEYTKLVKLNILQQSAQAMMVHSNEDANRVLQLLQ